MNAGHRLAYLDNLRTVLIFLVVLVHAGVVYESSGIMGPYWIVDDPATSDLPGLVNLMLDLFVMPTMFFISGYLALASLTRHGWRGFLKARFRRLVVPWILALFTLIPLYNALFLYSRGLPREGWARYFHFSNDTIGMSWLWFLPVLFLFDAVYALLGTVGPRVRGLTLRWAVAAVFAVNVGSCLVLSELGWVGWTKTPLVDFQNERLLPYFMLFLLGSFCRRNGILETERKGKAFYIAVCSTLWIPMNVYLIVLINFFLRPGQYIVSAGVDGLVLWVSQHLSMLGLLYCMVMTFKFWVHRESGPGQVLGKLSYGVYIVHLVVMGPFALALLDSGLPALAKYPLLALATYLASNLVVLAWSRGSALFVTEATGSSRGTMTGEARLGRPERPATQP